MKAVTWQAKGKVSVESVPDPTISESTDAIIRVTSTAICGSDLHLYGILSPFMEKGDILGHEPMGIVVEVGSAVTKIKKGDRVVVPFNIACGTCFMCTLGLTSQCETTQVHEHNRGAALFGYSKLYGQVPGGQAEFLRVPHADFMAKKIPDEMPDERFLFLSDVVPTAWQGVAYANIPEGGSVVVLGLGPIGDMATRIAQYRGAKTVIGVDLVPERLERAKAHGVITFDTSEYKEDGAKLAEDIKSITDGRGPDAVIDAVGMEAHGSKAAQAGQALAGLLPDPIAEKVFTSDGFDRLAALHAAIEIVRRGGTISLSGVYAGKDDPMPMDTLFDKQIQLRMGQANAAHLVDELLPLLEKDNLFDVENFSTHSMPLDDAPYAYEIFQKKEDGAIKIVLKP